LNDEDPRASNSRVAESQSVWVRKEISQPLLVIGAEADDQFKSNQIKYNFKTVVLQGMTSY